MTTPRHLRELKAKMALKGLSLSDVATQSGVHYTTASMILNGRLLSPKNLAKIEEVIKTAEDMKGAAV